MNYDELKLKYPLALRNVYCGFSCPDEWLEEVIKVLEVCETEAVEVVQVKSKWGSLRIYTDRNNENVDNAIKVAEAACARLLLP